MKRLSKLARRKRKKLRPYKLSHCYIIIMKDSAYGRGPDSQPETQRKPTTADHIQEGRAKIRYNGPDNGFLQDREINGRIWSGSTFAYDVEVPSAADQDKMWQTELRLWTPLPIYSNKPSVSPPSRNSIYLPDRGKCHFLEILK